MVNDYLPLFTDIYYWLLIINYQLLTKLLAQMNISINQLINWWINYLLIIN